VWDMRGSLLTKGHPLFNHDRLCEGASRPRNQSIQSTRRPSGMD
jgi:hypothetical protein